MYESFFGLRERPFDLTPTPRYLVLTDSHREALRNLEYGIASRTGVTLLIGESGSGKTTVIRAAMETQPRRVHCVHINNPTLARAEFIELLAMRFGLSAEARQSKAVFLIEFERLLADRQASGEASVLIVDEAQSLPLELLEEIRLLANVETNDTKLVSVILAGQPELADRLNDRSLRQLKQRVALRCELRPLSRAETDVYVAGRIRAAGGIAAQVFTRDAVSLMHEAAHGLPRTINVIADNALLGGFASGQKPVNTMIVRDVCHDFDVLTPESRELPAERVTAGAPPGPIADVAAVTATEPRPRADLRSVESGASSSSVERRVGTEMFESFSAKRKRFSFFRS